MSAETYVTSKHHKELAAGIRVCCAVLTVSSSRSEQTDETGKLIEELLRSKGHEVLGREVVREDPELIRRRVESWLADQIDVLILNGGTGISKQDHTTDVILSILEKELEGFGELFRFLSYEEVGPASMLSRAKAGVANGKLVFCLPGSPNAARLAMEKLILPELQHMVWELRR